MARPRKKIDPKQVEHLASINCSYAEIAAVLDCDPSLIALRFSAAMKRGREKGKSSLKRRMWTTAMGIQKLDPRTGQPMTNEFGVPQYGVAPNVVMQIFLSKNLLGYSDKVDFVETDKPEKLPEPTSDGKPIEYKPGEY